MKEYRNTFCGSGPKVKDVKTEQNLRKDGMSVQRRNRLDGLYEEVKEINISGGSCRETINQTNRKACENLIKYLRNLIRQRCVTEGKSLYKGAGEVNPSIGLVCSEI
jgi:hypothetical protein